MESSSQSLERHGWPKSAPPKCNAEIPDKHSDSTNANTVRRGYPYGLPPAQLLPGTQVRESQCHTKLMRHSYHNYNPKKTTVSDVGNLRTSLPSIAPSNQERQNRRAVIIAATYTGTPGVPKTEDISHAISLFRLLTVTFRFQRDNVWMLTDAPEKFAGCPVKLGATRRNILTSLKWLVSGSKGGDILFLGISGLGATITKRDVDQERQNVCEDCFIPTDYPTSSPISQTQIALLLVKGLHINASLTTLIDTKDSSKVLRLPYVKTVQYISKAKIAITESPEPEATRNQEAKQSLIMFMSKYSRVKHEYNRMRRRIEREECAVLAAKFSQNGKVFAFGFAGPSEHDRVLKRRSIAVGALTQAFVDCILEATKAKKEITHAYVLQTMCEAVAVKRNSQPVQVASTHRLDMCTSLVLLQGTFSK